MSGARRSWLGFLLGCGVAAGLLWFFFRGTDWAQVGRALQEAQPALLMVGLAFNVGCGLSRSWRWRLLLSPLDPDFSLGRAWRYYVIGLSLSTVVPGRVGDLVRPYLASRSRGVTFSGALATIVSEHVLDLFMVLAFFSLMFVLPDVLGAAQHQAEMAEAFSALRVAGAGYVAVALVVSTILLFLRWRPAATLALLERFAAPLPKRLAGRLLGLSRDFSLGVSGLRGPRALASLVASTLAVWTFNALGTWCFLLAFGLSAPLTHVAWLSAATALGVALPTPGGTGTYHAAAIIVVGGLWGFGAEQGAEVAAFAIVSHLAFSLLLVSLAPWYILREGLAPSHLTAQALAAQQSASAQEQAP